MYLFFIRHFNDVDHICPIVWKMRQDNYPVAVYCLNPEYDLQKDYRLVFLKQLSIKVAYIYDEFSKNLGLKHRAWRLISRVCFAAARWFEGLEKSSNFTVFEKLRRRAQKVGKKYFKRCKKKFYNQSWAQYLLSQNNAQVLIFDWIRPNWFVVNMLIMAAKNMSVPAVSVPHGVFVYTNHPVTLHSKDEEKNFNKFNLYDYVVVQSNLYKEVITRSGVDRDKILVLGSARYCPEWMQQNRKILPRSLGKNQERNQKFKVVFMTTRPNYRIDVPRMLKTFEMLSRLDELNAIEVVIKPHTRSGEEAAIYNGLPLENMTDLSSVELCEWADVMLVIGSSILIEALIQRKPVLYLKYLHGNTTLYEDLEACWIINDEDQLRQALISLKDDKRKVPYNDKNADKFLSEIIYGGQNERDVLSDYENFILGCS